MNTMKDDDNKVEFLVVDTTAFIKNAPIQVKKKTKNDIQK